MNRNVDEPYDGLKKNIKKEEASKLLLFIIMAVEQFLLD